MRYIISFLLTSATSMAAPIASAQTPLVVTDIPPVHALTALVMGDLGTPTLLLTKGANEHDFQLRPSQAAEVASADLIVWIGPELTPWLDRAATSLAPGTPQLALLDAEPTLRLAYTDTAPEGEAPTDKTATEDDHDHDHDHAGTNPHAWLDPDNALIWLPLIAAELARLDPANAAIYTANATSAATGITALDARLQAQLAPVKAKPFVAYHDAYGYFTAHFGLTMAGSVAIGDASNPGAARITALAHTIRDGGAVCLFPEAQHDPALLTQLAGGSGARIGAALDPTGSLQDPGPGAYAATLTAIANALTQCLTP